MKMEELWMEKDLTKRLGLAIGKTGRSRTISRWIREGLKHIEKDSRRYFIESDILTFLKQFYIKSDKS